MSGIAGIFNLDGAPIARPILARVAGTLSASGRERASLWAYGPVGLAHALLKVGERGEQEQQPFSLDGRVWVVADARIDAQDFLRAELNRHGQHVHGNSSDIDLIARAYAVWGERCVDHLLGDFAIGVWDEPSRRLFCARDHLGVKPLHYAFQGRTVIFSSSLDAIRCYPTVSGRLNDQAITDFLLFQINWDRTTTAFADIRRLPPAHAVTWSASGEEVRCYWTLPIDEPLFYPSEKDYVDQFRELLGVAVADRVRTSRVAVFMSGGLDSTTLAAVARDSLRTHSEDAGVRAFTGGYSPDDEECVYATIAAKALGISIEFQYWKADEFDPHWYDTSHHTPEPIQYPTDLPRDRANYDRMALHSQIAFFGEGPDNALRCEWRPYLSYLFKKKSWGRILSDLHFQASLHGQLPWPTFRFAARIRQHEQEKMTYFPEWIQLDLQKRYDLPARYRQITSTASSHPLRPVGHSEFTTPQWQRMFERYWPEYTGALLEVRHPYLDIRMLRFLLALPALPWCRFKYLFRRSMRGILPEQILSRTKPHNMMSRDPWDTHIRSLGLPPVRFTPELEHFVDKGRIVSSNDPARFWIDFRVRSLAYWLRNKDAAQPSYSQPQTNCVDAI